MAVTVAVAERIGAAVVTADERLLTQLRHVPWVMGVQEALAR